LGWSAPGLLQRAICGGSNRVEAVAEGFYVCIMFNPMPYYLS
jgi:hypothetical protein